MNQSLFACIHLFCFVFRIPWYELPNFPNWALLYLYQILLPFLGLSSIGLKIIIQNGKQLRREILGSQTRNNSRPVVPGYAGCAMAHPDFGRSVNPISTRGEQIMHT